jgi:hypothetical protein
VLPANSQNTLLLLFLCTAALVFASPALVDFGHWGVLDWDFQLHHHAVPRTTLLDYGQLPLWNPFNRSGVPMLAHPESRLLSPTFLLTLAFGEVKGLKLELLLHLVIALAGTRALLREWRVDEVGALAGAFAFAFSGCFAIHLTVGHVWALSFAWLPWLLLGYERARDSRGALLATGGVLVVIFFSGAPYPFMVGWLMLGLHAACSAAAHRDFGSHARRLGLLVAMVASLSAIKLVPTGELMSAFPRTTPSESGYTFAALGNALFDPDQTLAAARAERPEEFNGTPLHEGLYVGWVALALFGVGVAARGRRHGPLLAVGALFFWIALGQHAPIDLWRWIHPFPGFDNMRMVQRVAVVGLLYASIFVGFGVGAIGRRSRPAAWVVSALLLLELMAVNRPILRDAFTIAPLTAARVDGFEQHRALPYYDGRGWIEGRRPTGLPAMSSLYPAVLASRGSTQGYYIVPFVSHGIAVEAPGYRGEAFLEGGAAVDLEDWSPNRMQVRLSSPLAAPDRLIVNQNHNRGWRASAVEGDERRPRPVVSERGLIAVALQPGDTHVELRYRPPSFRVGAVISSLAVLGWGGFWLSPRFRRAPRPDR